MKLNLTKKEREHDDLLLAKLIAGAEMHPKYNVAPGGGFLSDPGTVRQGHACAIGAGVLYLGIDRSKIMKSTLSLFVDTYKVSHEMADGISDGFESESWNEEYECLCASKDSTRSYYRGYRVGAAVRSYSSEKYGDQDLDES